MDAETRTRAFEAFYTTKENTGTGLGLWVSQEILNKHHGTVLLCSRPAAEGKTSGTVFQFFIPDDGGLPLPAEMVAN
jgi:signal transduction histidine kinase